MQPPENACVLNAGTNTSFVFILYISAVSIDEIAKERNNDNNNNKKVKNKIDRTRALQ